MKKSNLKNDFQNAIDENLLDQMDSNLNKKENKKPFQNFNQAKLNKEVDIKDIPVVLPQKYRLQIYIDEELGNKLAAFMKKNKLSQSKAVGYILKEFFK